MKPKTDHVVQAERRERELIAEAIYVARVSHLGTIVDLAASHASEAFRWADAFIAERDRQRAALGVKA